MEILWQELRYTVRRLIQSPGFTLSVALMLALGIGANTAIFSVVNSLFLKPLPAANPNEIVVMTFKQKASVAPPAFSYPDFQDVKAASSDAADLCGFQIGLDSLVADHKGEKILSSYVTGNFFAVLGLEPAAGRLILPAEGNIPGTDPVLVLSYDYWRSRFNGDQSVVGKAVKMNGHQFTIAGVAPKGFNGLFSIANVQVYAPLNMVTTEDLITSNSWQDRGAHILSVAGRLKPGMTVAQYQSLLDVVAARLAAENSKTDQDASIRVFPEKEQRLQPNPEPRQYNTQIIVVGFFFSLSGVVLFLACSNVANILLARAISREHETATRAALGAKTSRLIRPLVMECLLLSLLGAAGGILLRQWATVAIRSIRLPGAVPFQLDMAFDWRVFAFAFGMAAFTGLVLSVFPVLRAKRVNITEQLHESSRSHSTRRNLVRNSLVAVQVASSIVLLIIAGLFTRSLQELHTMNLGFNPNNVVNFRIDSQQIGYDRARTQVFSKELLRRVRSLPGIQSASAAFCSPFCFYRSSTTVLAEGQVLAPGAQPLVVPINQVSTDYFATLGISLLRGRQFAENDVQGLREVAIINESLAKALWPNDDALGKRLRFSEAAKEYTEVVGIVQDSKTATVVEPPHPYIYVPITQQPISMQTLMVRSSMNESEVIRAVKAEIQAIDPDLPTFDVQSMNDLINNSPGFLAFRLGAGFAWALGGLGLVLVVVGVYSVASYAAAQQTFDIGIRLALGAQYQDIGKMILWQWGRITAIGLFSGLAIAFLLTRQARALFVGVNAHDPLIFGSASVLVMGIALAACFVPLRRAMNVNPAVVLRPK
jgi:putative ABC transport system permease protein